MKRHFPSFVILFLVFSTQMRSQYYFYNDKYYNSPVLLEVGISAAGFNCLTDLGGRKGEGQGFIKDINLQHTHIGAGVYVGVLFDQLLGIRAEVAIGKVSASDYVLKNDVSTARNRFQRNLQFESRIAELSVIAEFMPFSLLKTESHRLFSPYILAGIGLFRFNPRAYF